jgi:hypothetical protein
MWPFEAVIGGDDGGLVVAHPKAEGLQEVSCFGIISRPVQSAVSPVCSLMATRGMKLRAITVAPARMLAGWYFSASFAERFGYSVHPGML